MCIIVELIEEFNKRKLILWGAFSVGSSAYSIKLALWGIKNFLEVIKEEVSLLKSIDTSFLCTYNQSI